MPVYEITSARGGLSDNEDKGPSGSFKFASNIDIRKSVDSISAGQALKDEGIFGQSASMSPSHSRSPSASNSPSPSKSQSPSTSLSLSVSPSPSASRSPSSSLSPSASISPSSSISQSPSPSSGFTTIFQDLIRFFVKCSDGFVYGFGNTGKIYKRLGDGEWLMVYDIHKQIKGALEKPSETGNTYILFATDTELHRKQIPGLSNWGDVDLPGSVQGDTWPKTNLKSSDWHTMQNVGGDIMIANASTLAMSAYDDSYTNEALDLIPGNIAKTVIERNGRAVVGTYKAGDPNKGVNAAIDSEVPLIQVGDEGYIFYGDFKTSMPVKQFPGGGKVNPGGVANMIEQVDLFDWEVDALSWIDKQVIGNLAVFGVYGATTGKNGLYTYGRKNKNQPFVLNLEYALEVEEIGAVVVIDGVLLCSYFDGSEFGVKVVDSENKAIGIYEGLDFKFPMKLPVNVSLSKYVELYTAPLPSGTSIEFWYRMNKTGSFVQARLGKDLTNPGSNSFTTTNAQKAIFSIPHQGDIYEPRIVLNPSGNLTPEVYRIRTYFQ